MATKKTSPRGKKILEKKNQEFVVAEPSTLLAYLLTKVMPERSRNAVKQQLRDGFVGINGVRITQFDAPLNPNDVVTIFATPKPEAFKHPLVSILYHDQYLVVVHKEAGISTIASGQDHKNTALRVVADYFKSIEPGSMLFMLNRLDKDTAGIVLFARDRELQQEMIGRWRHYVPMQRFTAVAEGVPLETKGELKGGQARKPSGKGLANAKKKKTAVPEGIGQAEYIVLKKGPFCSLFGIELKKGRNPQIRKQLAALDMPIVGDHHNGSKNKKLSFIALVGNRIEFIHPVDGKPMAFEIPVPVVFGKLLRTPLPKEQQNISE